MQTFVKLWTLEGGTAFTCHLSLQLIAVRLCGDAH